MRIPFRIQARRKLPSLVHLIPVDSFGLPRLAGKENVSPIMSKANEVNLLDHGFVDARIKAIDIAAFLDRVQCAGQEDDYRVLALREALRHLLEEDPDRAKRVLLSLSDPTDEPIPVAPGKGAAGAWPG